MTVWQQRAEVAEQELADRRACLVGARQTLETVKQTLANAESLELARGFLNAQIAERLELVDQAISNTDAALSGRAEVAE